MNIRPVLSALAHHKTGTLLVSLQIAVSLAIIVNSMFIINARIEKMNRPTGMDIPNLIAVSLRGAGDDYDAHENIARDLDMLRSLPGVTAATVTNHFPLSGSGSATGLRTEPREDAQPLTTGRWQTDAAGVSTLGVTLTAGRDFYPEEIEYRQEGEEAQTPAVVIVTRDLAESLYPDEEALGKPVYWGDLEASTIVGIVEHMQGSWINWDGLNRNIIMPRVSSGKSARYLVRTEPGSRDKLLGRIEPELVALNPNRVIRYVRAHEDIVNESYQVDRAMTGILATVIILLVVLTALVIVGLASWFVSQRTRQIGTRRALGATRGDILGYFLVENWLITTLGASVGVVLTVGVSYVLETTFDLPRLDWRYLAASVVALWAISQLAAFLPARRAANIPPAIATRTV